MLNDRVLRTAVNKIAQRAERQLDIDKLVETFVDVGFLGHLDNRNNLIVYGRRGTGKTHALKVLESSYQNNVNVGVVYIDCRKLGSSAQFSDPSASIESRCLALFRDIMGEVQRELLNYIWDQIERDPDVDVNLELCDDLVDALDVSVKKAVEVTRKDKIVQQSSQSSGIGFNAGIQSGFRAVKRLDESGLRERESDFELVEDEKLYFPVISNTINDVLEQVGGEFYILIDEWAEIPFELQPYLAEFIKKAFFANPRVALKIAALENRSNFGVMRANGGLFGFEIGADISSRLDLDDYFIYDRNPSEVTKSFSEILYNHLRSELEGDYLQSVCGIGSATQMQSRLFTSKNTFEELVRASEGVARDLINVFSRAYTHSERKGKDKIQKESIIEGARQWFENNKEPNLSPALRDVLSGIVNEVIGNRQARSFLLKKELQDHDIIQQLFDSRVIHLMERGYADKDNPGIRYNIYTLDYGTYVDLINTSKEPELQLKLIDEEEGDEERVVPFDDKRSIRRIVLTEEFLGRKSVQSMSVSTRQAEELHDKEEASKVLLSKNCLPQICDFQFLEGVVELIAAGWEEKTLFVQRFNVDPSEVDECFKLLRWLGFLSLDDLTLTSDGYEFVQSYSRRSEIFCSALMSVELVKRCLIHPQWAVSSYSAVCDVVESFTTVESDGVKFHADIILNLIGQCGYKRQG